MVVFVCVCVCACFFFLLIFFLVLYSAFSCKNQAYVVMRILYHYSLAIFKLNEWLVQLSIYQCLVTTTKTKKSTPHRKKCIYVCVWFGKTIVTILIVGLMQCSSHFKSMHTACCYRWFWHCYWCWGSKETREWYNQKDWIKYAKYKPKIERFLVRLFA